MSDARDTRKEILGIADAVGAKSLVDFVAPALDHFADQVWCFGLGATSDERKALGLVAQMGAELMLGAAAMYQAAKLYAGSSLVRQLIEVDYLSFLLGMDSAEGSRWLNGGATEHKQLFQPAAMRKRAGSRFDVDEYSRHCEMGGHRDLWLGRLSIVITLLPQIRRHYSGRTWQITWYECGTTTKPRPRRAHRPTFTRIGGS